MIDTYADIYKVLKFAKRFEATTITIETDFGDLHMTPDEALQEFDGIAPGQPFSIVNISFEDDE